jgi:NADH:ubiquinone oxidoreductase subunit K
MTREVAIGLAITAGLLVLIGIAMLVLWYRNR